MKKTIYVALEIVMLHSERAKLLQIINLLEEIPRTGETDVTVPVDQSQIGE